MTKNSNPDFVTTEVSETASDTVKSVFAFAANGPQQAVNAWLRINAECLRFASHRLAAQSELLGKLCQCGNADEFVAAETRFLENAADEYSQEIDQIAEVVREQVGQGASTPLKRAAAKAA